MIVVYHMLMGVHLELWFSCVLNLSYTSLCFVHYSSLVDVIWKELS